MFSLISRFKNGIYRDFVLGLITSVVTTAVAQLVAYPVLAHICTSAEYGMLLTIMGIGNTVMLTFGNSLNNIRLIMNADYDEKGYTGDYLPLTAILGMAGALAYCIYLIWFGEKSIILIISLCGFVLCGVLQSYGSVAFRIKIDYVKNLLLNIYIVGGNVFGLLVFYFTKNHSLWALTFVIGQIFGVVYIYLNSSIFKEPFKFTPLFMKTLKKEGVLLFTTLCANILAYLDRLILYPLLGADMVSTYTVASFFGKSFAILVNPISGVLLSYYAEKKYIMNTRRFWKSNIQTLVVAVAFMVLCLFASDRVTGLLYPSLIKQAKPYLFIANLAAVMNVVGNMAQPVVLKFAPTEWLGASQISYITIYLGIGIALSRTNGLMGFSQASLIAATVRVLFLYSIGHFFLRKKSNCSL